MESDLTLTKTLNLADTVETAERETRAMQHRQPGPAEKKTAGRPPASARVTPPTGST